MENVNVSGEFGRKPTLEFTDSTPSDELLVEVLHEGDGQVVEPGDTIHCHYLGQVWDGNVFDNSYDRGAPLSFQIGVGMVIRGWDEGLLGMKVGGRRRLEIPADMAYGDRGAGSVIKPGESLIFVVDLLDVR